MKRILTTALATWVAVYGYSQVHTDMNGNVGVGTTTPQSKLDVVGEIRSTNSGSNLYWAYMKANWAENNVFELGLSGHKLLTTDNYYYGSALNFWTSDAKRMTINSDGNVGIGTTSPQATLDVNGSAIIAGSGNTLTLKKSNNVPALAFQGVTGASTIIEGGDDYLTAWLGGDRRMTILSDGNVGIGTSAPGAKQEIYLANGGKNQFRLNTGFNGGNYIDINPFITGINNGGFSISQNGSIRFVIDNSGNGNVGIGTTDPQGYKLAVAGKIRATEIKVEALPWPDYVFSSSYKLPDLEATEQFIRENKHLPGIPSAKEVEKDGVNLGEMNSKLLQKIEELTLHLIEKDKQIQNLQDGLRQMNEKLDNLIQTNFRP